MMTKATLGAATLAALCLTLTSGHGRLLDPISRMSAWRLGFPTPRNYYDHGMNCGSFQVQWMSNGGRCGICGDSWSGPRYYERPNGIMVKHDVITKEYRENDVITATVEVTAPHMGWNEFRICDVAKSGGIEATQECLNRTLLTDNSGRSRFFFTTNKTGLNNYSLVLPKGFTCSHCVFQWKWKVGNSWGCDETGCGLGHGVVQEEFYGCSDVKIVPKGTSVVATSRPTTPKKATTKRTPQTTTRSPVAVKTSTTRKPAGTTRKYTGATKSPNYYQILKEIFMRYNLPQRTFGEIDEEDPDLNLDDELPQEISGQDFLQMLLNQQDVNKLPFIDN
ncbi:unnamed protein product [Lymnaea stagnalis]|uniref:Chitin-binding type-4 domain-containing protein n=1 Tax=Lymnaea stagnalis TaxID=6523 RepID=A0AAV2HVK9_LYMST